MEAHQGAGKGTVVTRLGSSELPVQENGTESGPGSDSVKVSICIPTYNQVKYLRAAVESAFAQTLDDLEVIVSDNHCTDGSAEYLASLQDRRLRVVRPPHHVSANENFDFCIGHAQGRYISLLCSDDLLAPRFARTMSDIMDAHEKVAFAYSAIEWIDEHGRSLGSERHVGGSFHRPGNAELPRFLKGSGCNFPTVMIRRKLYEAAGGYSSGCSIPNAVCIGDWDLELRLLELGDIFYHDEVLGSFRVWSTHERDSRLFTFIRETDVVYRTRIADLVSRRPELQVVADRAREARALAFAYGIGRYATSPRFEEGVSLILSLADTPTIRFVLWLHRRRLTALVGLRNNALAWLRRTAKDVIFRLASRREAASVS